MTFLIANVGQMLICRFILQKVEQASDFAAAQAFGKARAGNSTKSSILHTVDQLHDHDAAYEEGNSFKYDSAICRKALRNLFKIIYKTLGVP